MKKLALCLALMVLLLAASTNARRSTAKNTKEQMSELAQQPSKKPAVQEEQRKKEQEDAAKRASASAEQVAAQIQPPVGAQATQNMTAEESQRIVNATALLHRRQIEDVRNELQALHEELSQIKSHLSNAFAVSNSSAANRSCRGLFDSVEARIQAGVKHLELTQMKQAHEGAEGALHNSDGSSDDMLLLYSVSEEHLHYLQLINQVQAEMKDKVSKEVVLEFLSRDDLDTKSVSRNVVRTISRVIKNLRNNNTADAAKEHAEAQPMPLTSSQ